jgi:cobalt-zinc-cadmium efflux system outer membrane protein
MIREFRCFAVAVIITLVPFGAEAQSAAGPPPLLAEQYVDRATGVSLAAAIQQALEREPLLRATRSEIEVARGMKDQAGAHTNPMVSFERREQPGSGTDNQTLLNVDWPLDLYRRGPRVVAAEREIEAAQYAAADRARITAGDVRMRYGNAAAAARDVAVADNLVAAAKEQLALLAGRVEQGAAPPLDRDVFQVEVRRLESERLLAAARADAAIFELRRAMGLPPDQPLKLRDPLESLLTAGAIAAPALNATVPATRADVREAETRANLATAQIEKAESEGRIDMAVFGAYMRMDSGFPQRGFDDIGAVVPVHGVFNYVALGVRVTLPLRNQNEGAVAAARASAIGAAARVDAVRLTAQSETAAAAVRASQTRAALVPLQEGVELARQTLAVARQTYELGRMTAADVLAEQRRYWEVERAYTDVLRQAYEAQASLQSARGELP